MDRSTEQVESERAGQPPRALMIMMRIVLPVAIFLIGVVLVIMGHGHYSSVFANRDSLLSATGVGFWVIAACIWMLNWMMQMNADDVGDRQKEDDARAYFVRHGHWPGEGPAK
jgi:hypothetical protein